MVLWQPDEPQALVGLARGYAMPINCSALAMDYFRATGAPSWASGQETDASPAKKGYK